MLRINRKVEYALMALKYMSQKTNGKLSSAREICDQFKTPFDTTAKVMQTLNHKEILNSVKGVKGGYFLAKDLSDITFYELCQMIEGKLDQHETCIKGDGANCEHYETCNIATPLENLGAKIISVFQQLSLKDLLELNPNIDFKIDVLRGPKIEHSYLVHNQASHTAEAMSEFK